MINAHNFAVCYQQIELYYTRFVLKALMMIRSGEQLVNARLCYVTMLRVAGG